MARFYPSNSVSSTGVSSDDVTITSLDVPESKTALTADSENEVIKGKLKEIGSATEAVGSIDSENNRVQLTIPTRALYSLTAKLFTNFSDLANLIGLIPSKIAQGETILGVNGAFKGLGDAKQADVRSGKTFSTAELSDVPGTMAEHSGGTFKPGTSDKTIIAADRYLAGDVIVKGEPNLIAANIKKNVTLFGVTGTWEGYVIEQTYLYNSGNNLFNLRIMNTDIATFESDHINILRQTAKEMRLIAGNSFNFSKYTKINFECTVNKHSTSEEAMIFTLFVSDDPNNSSPTKVVSAKQKTPLNQKVVCSVSLDELPKGTPKSGYISLRINSGNESSHNYTSAAKIHRIWLSMD